MSVRPRKRRIKPQKSKKPLLFWVTTVVCSVGILLISDSGIIKLYKLEKEKKQLESEIKQLQSDFRALDKDIEELRDPEFVAQLAREKYRMVKPQEKVFKVVDE